MEIYPEDLGPRQCGQVLEHRMWRVGTDGAERATAPLVSPSGRVQILPKRGTASIWHYLFGGIVAAWITMGFGGPFWTALLFCEVIALLLRQTMIQRSWASPRGTQAAPPSHQHFAEPKMGTYARLTEAEVSLLQNALLKKGGDDPLLGMYLELVWAAMNTAPLKTGQADTERNAREAIRALGGAIETLPPRTLEGVPDSHAKLEALAARLSAEAPQEADPVVAASLGRRAEALRGQAETVARIKVLLRRNLALREELADQIGALRTSLAAAALGGDDCGLELAGLAARIRRVASEANAVTAARVEVDTLLSQPQIYAGVPAAREEARQQILGLNGEPV